MLITTLSPSEKIIINDKIVIVLIQAKTKANKIRIGIDAPLEYKIVLPERANKNDDTTREAKPSNKKTIPNCS